MMHILSSKKFQNIVSKQMLYQKDEKNTRVLLFCSQKRKAVIKPGISIVFKGSVHFLNNKLDNLTKTLGENDFYHPKKEFNTNLLSLINPNLGGLLEVCFEVGGVWGKLPPV